MEFFFYLSIHFCTSKLSSMDMLYFYNQHDKQNLITKMNLKANLTLLVMTQKIIPVFNVMTLSCLLCYCFMYNYRKHIYSSQDTAVYKADKQEKCIFSPIWFLLNKSLTPNLSKFSRVYEAHCKFH